MKLRNLGLRAPIQYRMERPDAVLRADLKIEKEAFAFAEAFGGSVLR